MSSTIIAEIRALALHHRAFDLLQGRPDIVGHATVPASVEAYLPRLLVAGLDYDAEPGNGGWPLPTGGRYRKLCFSPIIENSATVALVQLDVHKLPETENDFQEYVSLITGWSIDNADDLFRVFRFDPSILYHACRQMRSESPPAWRLLLSNEFELAARAWPALKKPVAGLDFKNPLIHGFMFLAEQERASLIMRRLARADAIMNRPTLLAALKSSEALSASFAADELPEVYRWLEYSCFSSEALRGLLVDRKVDEILELPDAYPLWALARGDVPDKTSLIFDEPSVRASLVREFSLPVIEGSTERRKQMLRDDHVVRWYGMTNEVLPILVLEGARECFPTRKISKAATLRNKVSNESNENSRKAVIRLASALRNVWDGTTQVRLMAAANKYNDSLRIKREVTLEKNLKLGRKRALNYLPPIGRLGSAARFNPLMWGNSSADNELWSMFIAPTNRPVALKLDHPERWKVRESFTILRRVFAPIVGNMEETPLTLKIANDMAAALSPVSGNLQIAFAIAKLDLAPDLRQRLGYLSYRAGFNRK